MALLATVKVSGVTNLHDARYCAGMGVNMVGFPLTADAATEGAGVSKEQFEEIAGWLSGVRFVGETNGLQLVDLHGYSLDLVQVEGASDLAEYSSADAPIILRLAPQSDGTLDLAAVRATMERAAIQVEYFLLESEKEALSAAEREGLAAICADFPVLLGYGFTAQTVKDVLETVQPAGLALRPGKEIQVGVNDFDALADVLEAIEVD